MKIKIGTKIQFNHPVGRQLIGRITEITYYRPTPSSVSIILVIVPDSSNHLTVRASLEYLKSEGGMKLI